MSKIKCTDLVVRKIIPKKNKRFLLSGNVNSRIALNKLMKENSPLSLKEAGLKSEFHLTYFELRQDTEGFIQ